MDYNLRGGTVIILFATPTMLEALAPKFLQDVEAGTRVVCYHFPFAALGKAADVRDCTHPLKPDGPPTQMWMYEIKEKGGVDADAPGA